MILTTISGKRVIKGFELSSKTFKNDKRYVNFMSVLTNLTSMISNYKSQEFSMKQEIQIEQDKLEDQRESETKENK